MIHDLSLVNLYRPNLDDSIPDRRKTDPVRICLSEPGEKIPLEEGKEFFHKVVDRERQIRYIISIKIVHNLI